jgi:hypothetical protein
MKKLFYLLVMCLCSLLLGSGCSKTKEKVEPTPTIVSFTPGSGMMGTSVVITGNNFSATAANNIVKFNGMAATVSAATTTSLTVQVPAGATTGKVTVQAGNQTVASGNDFEVFNTSIEFTVKDGKSWSVNNSLNVVSGATINLYESQADVTSEVVKYTAVTDASGKVTIPVAFKSYYYFTVQKGNAKNIYNDLLVAGIFQSQDEIQSSAQQSPWPTVGSVKYADLNGDGIINSLDKANSGFVQVVESQKNVASVVIYE